MQIASSAQSPGGGGWRNWRTLLAWALATHQAVLSRIDLWNKQEGLPSPAELEDYLAFLAARRREVFAVLDSLRDGGGLGERAYAFYRFTDWLACAGCTDAAEVEQRLAEVGRAAPYGAELARPITCVHLLLQTSRAIMRAELDARGGDGGAGPPNAT